MISIKRSIALFLVTFAFCLGDAHAYSRSELDRDARTVLNQLISSNASAKTLSEKAIATLVFPVVTKAGFILGANMAMGFYLGKADQWLITTLQMARMVYRQEPSNLAMYCSL